MGWITQRCKRCRQVLDIDEIYGHGGKCKACKGDEYARLNNVRGWRLWLRIIRFAWRRL